MNANECRQKGAEALICERGRRLRSSSLAAHSLPIIEHILKWWYNNRLSVCERRPMMDNYHCFENLCACSCNTILQEFDTIISAEANFDVTLRALCRSNIGWFADKSISVHHLHDWGISNTIGVYLLWQKNGYCSTHDLHHMRSLYVGKGNIKARLIDHWKMKDFADEMLVYWTFLEMPNRQAKYVEQLLLDLYKFPYNKSESHGALTLCTHLPQSELD